jgi:hypothetical protein
VCVCVCVCVCVRVCHYATTGAVLSVPAVPACSTDAVSVDVEEGLYMSLRDAGVTTITISKRLALTDFHDAELQLCALA